MDQQLLMSYTRPRGLTQRAAERLLVNLLRGKEWTSSYLIEQALGWSDRKVRAVASGCDWVISAPGGEGYRFIHDATPDEYHHYRNARRAQVREMLGKVMRTDRVFFNHREFPMS